VIGRPIGCVASLAIGETSVIEVRRLPRIGRVTLAALAREVIGRLIDSVAHRAVGEASVIDYRRLPR